MQLSEYIYSKMPEIKYRKYNKKPFTHEETIDSWWRYSRHHYGE